MALETNELYQSTNVPPRKRIQPSDGPGAVKACTFDEAGSGVATVLPVGTPVCFNTSTNFWVPYSNAAVGAANGVGVIRGFVYPHPITLPANASGDQTTGQVLFDGQVHYADVKSTLESEISPAVAVTNLDAALRGSELREKGIDVQGLTQLR